MNDSKIRTLKDIHAFLNGTTEIEFSIEGRLYRWIEQTLYRFKYPSLRRIERGLLLRYL